MTAVSTGIRRQTKKVLRPFAKPLIRRLRLPFDILLPRIQQLERDVGAFDILHPRIEQLEKDVGALGGLEKAESLSSTVSNLTRAWMRQEQRVGSLTAEIDRRFAEFERAMQHTLDVKRQLLQDVAQHGARADFLADRIEFVRRELMFEMHYGSGGRMRSNGQARHPPPRILEPDKIAAARGVELMRVNLGCGHIAVADYINVDMRDLPGVDVVAEVGNLPFDPTSLDEIASAHLIEHFPQEELRRRLLPYWRSLLKPGGILRAITPDGAAMLDHVADGSYAFSDFREVLFGSQDYEGDFHFNLLTPDTLCELVQEAGFTDVEVPVQGRRNGQCFEFELTARLPASVATS